MIDVETDPLMTLLTEALRAGPQSAAWRDAVEQLRTTGGTQADEYQLLLNARESLESGKHYRAVHAGPGFTRKINEGLEKQERHAASGIPTATIVAVLGAAAIVAAIIWFGLHLSSHGQVERGKVDDLANTYFPTELLSAKFDDALPPGWRQIGQLPLKFARGMQPDESQSPVGGGIVAPVPLAPDEPFAVEAVLKLNHTSDSLAAQVFVSTSGDFSDDRATSSHELLWSLRGKTQQVVLDGRVLPISAAPIKDDTPHVRLVMSGDLAILECDGQRLWAGPHGLGTAQRWAGVRFIRSAPGGTSGVIFRSLRILKR
jgi:hypothetical protein